MINKKRLSIECCFIITSVLVMMGFVSAFGIGIPYSAQDPLKLYPGQSKDVLIGLQSSISEGDLTIVPEILEGQDIIKITDSSKEYNVIANQPVGAAVHLKVSIPDNDVIGKEYPVKFVFRDVTKREGGMVGISTSIGASFNVLVVEKPSVTKETPQGEGIKLIWWIVGIIVVIAIILVIYFIIKNMNSR